LQTIEDRLVFEKLDKPLELNEMELSHSLTSEVATVEKLISKNKLTWFVFLRNYYCPLCIKHVKALADAKEKLAQLQCHVIIVAPGERKGSELFNADVPTPFEIYLDTSESKKVYQNYGLKRSVKKMFGSHAWPLVAEFLLNGGITGKAYEGIKDEPLQMGGDYVLDSSGEILYSNVSRNVFDRPKVPNVMTLLQSTKL
jgi:peroxiredoxin